MGYTFNFYLAGEESAGVNGLALGEEEGIFAAEGLLGIEPLGGGAAIGCFIVNVNDEIDINVVGQFDL